MLPPDARAVLTEQLRPDPGWQLDYAVATTFTLDLPSTLVVPLAFAAHRLQDSSDPLAVMEAVRGCSTRIDVFCQAGNISVPREHSDLLAFLEPMIHPVGQPKPGRLFHPKIWLVRYLSPDTQDVSYRLLVLSRNLTADRSWDTCLRLDGWPGTRPLASNKPLADLLRYLPGQCVGPLADDRRQRLEQLAEDVRRILWEPPEGVRDIHFHALGIPGQRRPDFSGTRHLVIAPFCNAAGLSLVAPANSAAATVVSRQEDLDRLPPEVAERITAHVLNPLAGLTDEAAEANTEILVGLHAKLYVVEYDRSARVLVGSANATDAAFGGNIEVLVELEGTRSGLGIATMLGDGAPFLDLLEPHVRQESADNDEEDWELENLVRQLAAVPLTAQVHRDSGTYQLHLTSQDLMPVPPDVRVTMELLTRLGEAHVLSDAAPVDVAFTDLATTHLTPFVVLRARDDRGVQRSAVVHAVLLDDPADRLDEILARQVDTPEKFLHFIALLLGMADPSGLLASAGNGSGPGWASISVSGAFELIVRALVDQPVAIDELGRLVQRLQATEAGRALLPEGFTNLWAMVEKAHATLRPEPTR